MSGLARGTIHFRQGNSVTRFIYENFFVLIKKRKSIFDSVEYRPDGGQTRGKKGLC